VTDPATLRARARALRTAASTIRLQAATLGTRLPELRMLYPLPDPDLWSGPNADTYAAGLATAAASAERVVEDVLEYADACAARAVSLDRQADLLDAAG
jgi:hypothetical protein